MPQTVRSISLRPNHQGSLPSLKLRGGGVWVTLSSVILSKKTKKQKNKFTLSNTTLSKKFQKKN